MCSGKGTPGNRTTGKGKSGSSRIPRTLSLASLMCARDYGREATRSQCVAEKFGPRVRVGQRQRGPSSTPSDEEGFTYGACTDAKGSERPDLLSKNVSEQFHPVKGAQRANTREHVLNFKRLREKTIGAGGETCTTRFGRGVGAHNQYSRV